MKVVGINGSPKKDGNTAIIIKRVFGVLEKEGIETELIQLSGQQIHGCIGCQACFKSKNKKCMVENEFINYCIEKMHAADGIILGSPTYFADVTAGMKALMECAGYVSRANGNLFKHKVAAAVVAVRRGGAIHTLDSINHFLHYQQTFMVGSTYWNMVYGLMPGEVEKDDEGMANMDNIGENMAFLLKKLQK